MNTNRTKASILAPCLIFFAVFAAALPLHAGATSTSGTTDSDGVTTSPASKPDSDSKTGGSGKQPAAAVSKVRVGPKRVKHGSRVRVHGKVDRRSNRVGLYFRPSGSKRWVRLKKVATDGRGRYSTSVKARRNGQLRAVSSRGTASSPSPLRVRSRISVKPVRKYSQVGGRVLVRGSVSPAGKRWVKVVVGGSGGRTIRTRTRAHGGFKVSWRPRSTGSYRVRAFAAGNRAAASDASRRVRVTGMRQVHASYYGPGLYGGALACGGRLYPGTRGVAHKTLPCGTRVTLRYRGRTVTTRVIDRGPYVAGRELDLTAATRNDLGFGDIGTVWTSR